MEAWENWWRMAQGSLTAAQVLEQQGEYRSGASRAYYAAYQAVTALLLYAKQTPPEGREAWSHEVTPDLVKNLPKAILTQTAFNDDSTSLCQILRTIFSCCTPYLNIKERNFSHFFIVFRVYPAIGNG